MSLPIALQLHTVRELLDKDFVDTLNRVYDVGYRAVEIGGFHGKTTDELARLTHQAGLSIVSTHLPLETFEQPVEELAAIADTLDCRFLVCPKIPESQRTANGYDEAAEILNRAADGLATHGITVCYHNHAFEFEETQGITGMDRLFQPSCRFEAQMDLYWVAHASKDPLTFTAGYTGRVPLLHVKDMEDTEARDFAEVGTGTIKLRPILLQAPTWGTKWAIVEQDANWINGDPMESIRISYHNIIELMKL